MKKFLTSILLLAGLYTVYAVSPLSSPQVGSSPSNGYILRTNGKTNTWVSTSSLGISGTLSGGATGYLPYWTSATTLGAIATGTAGQLFMASSTSASGYGWVSTSSLGIIGGGGSPGGSDSQVQVNVAGAFGGYPEFYYSGVDQTLYLGAENSFGAIKGVSATTPDAVGGSIGMTAGYGDGSGAGGDVSLLAGSNISGTGAGGNITIGAGDGATGSNGGAVTVNSGTGGFGGVGGDISFTTSAGGDMTFTGGAGSAGSFDGGSFTMTAGNVVGGGTNNGGRFTLTAGTVSGGTGGGGTLEFYGGGSSGGVGGNIDFYPGAGVTQGAVRIFDPTNGFSSDFDNSSITASRVYSFPDKNGVFALLSDLASSTFQYFNIASGTSMTIGNLYATSSMYLPVINSVLATDATGKLVATTTTGTTYTGTYPILVNGSVISSAFSTSTNNIFTGFNSFVNASATNLTITGLLNDSTGSPGAGGNCLTSDGTSIHWGSCGSGSLSGGTIGTIARWASDTTLTTSTLFDDGIVAGVNATSSLYEFYIKGDTVGTNDLFAIASTTGKMLWAFGSNGQLTIATTTATTTLETGILGQIKLSGLTYVNKDVLATKIASSTSVGLQSALWDSNTMWWTAGAASGNSLNTAITALGTALAVAPTATNKYTSFRRSRWSTVVTTQNQQVGGRTDAQFFRSATSSNAGFFFKATFGVDGWTAGDRIFVGLSSCTTACLTGTTTLTNLANTIGFGVEGGTSQLVFLTNDGSGAISTTTISGLPTMASLNGYDVYMYNPVNSEVVYWRIDNINTGAKIAEGSVTTNLPANNTFMSAHVACSNGLNALANSCQIGLAQMYIEKGK